MAVCKTLGSRQGAGQRLEGTLMVLGCSCSHVGLLNLRRRRGHRAGR